MIVSVRRAVATTGGRNAFTPLLTASTPVMAVQPLANAWRMIQAPGSAAACRIEGGASTGTGWPPERNVLSKPITMAASRVPTNKYVGAMKITPVSRMPRRLMSVMRTRIPRQMDKV